MKKWIGKRFRSKVSDAEEDEEYGEVTHPIGSTFVVTERLQGGKEPHYAVAWEHALDAHGNAVPAKGMWTCWSEHELEHDAELVERMGVCEDCYAKGEVWDAPREDGTCYVCGAER